MKLFNRKLKCTRNLIYVKENNVIFTSRVKPIYHFIENLQKLMGIWDDKLYIQLYKEYIKHYSLYDLYPDMLYFMVYKFRVNIYSNITITNGEEKEIISTFTRIYKLVFDIPEELAIPVKLERLLLNCLDACIPYMDLYKGDGEDLKIKFDIILRVKYLSYWEERALGSVLDFNNHFLADTLSGLSRLCSNNTVSNILQRILPEELDKLDKEE